MRVKGHQPRRTEDQLLIKPFEIIRAELQPRAVAEKLLAVRAHLFRASLVADRYIAAAVEQQADQRKIADARADYRDTLVPDRLHIFVQCQNHHLITS